jgi:hypothetical protein
MGYDPDLCSVGKHHTGRHCLLRDDERSTLMRRSEFDRVDLVLCWTFGIYLAWHASYMLWTTFGPVFPWLLNMLWGR